MESEIRPFSSGLYPQQESKSEISLRLPGIRPKYKAQKLFFFVKWNSKFVRFSPNSLWHQNWQWSFLTSDRNSSGLDQMKSGWQKTPWFQIIPDNFRFGKNVGPDRFPMYSNKIRMESVRRTVLMSDQIGLNTDSNSELVDRTSSGLDRIKSGWQKPPWFRIVSDNLRSPEFVRNFKQGNNVVHDKNTHRSFSFYHRCTQVEKSDLYRFV